MLRRDSDSGIPQPTVLLAARDASEISKRKADWVVGEPFTAGFLAKWERIHRNGGRVLLTEGTFDDWPPRLINDGR